MADNLNVEDNTEELQISRDKEGFAAVPIHFRPGDGKVKRIKLVIPSIEPPLLFAEVKGDTPESITFNVVDGPDDGQNMEDSESDDSKEVAPPVEIDDPTAGQSEAVVTDDDSADTGEEEIDYPHEDDDGNPVAGFLIPKEDGVTPDIVVVKPKQGESAEEAMSRVGSDHPDHKEASLEEATAHVGHSPLTKQDNPPIQVEANIPGNPNEPVAWLVKGKQKIAVVTDEEFGTADKAIANAEKKHAGYKVIKGSKEPKV